MDMGCKYSLIFQTDTLLLNPNIEQFLQYHYVGAPWVHQWMKGVSVGNGGLSLRNIETMYHITSICPRDAILPFSNEDVFFGFWCKMLHLKVPSIESAKQFSVETIFFHNPCGLHKPHLHLFPSRESYTQLLKQKISLLQYFE